MKRTFILLLPMVGLLATTIFLHSCQKETDPSAWQKAQGLGAAADRAYNDIIYGVTLYNGSDPCRILGIDQNTGNVVSGFTAFVVDPASNSPVELHDLKGICISIGHDYFITTGPKSNAPYDNALFKLDILTGECFYISTCPFGAVSDLEYSDGILVGLLDNKNEIVTITDNGNNFTDYATIPLTGVSSGFRLQGLTLVYEPNYFYLVGCATSNDPNELPEMYKIDLLTGTANICADLDPVAELGAGHCAIGFDIDLQQILVNRNDGAGLNSFDWPSSVYTVPTIFWGGQNHTFEDLTSWAY